MECIYCHEESEFRRSIMEELCTLPYSTVYVFRSQTYYGRCVVAFRLRHVNELFELTAEERHGYMDDVARTASAIQRAVGAEKINYAIYGDLMPHVHFHLVPKRPGAPDWGGPFRMDAPVTELPEEEMRALRAALLREFKAWPSAAGGRHTKYFVLYCLHNKR